MRDFVGQEIVPGCTVVYPVRSGSSMWLSKLKVQTVLPDRIRGFNVDGRWVTVRNVHSCVVVPNAVH